MSSIKRVPFTLLRPTEHSSSLDDYPNLSRRQFLIKSSILAAASSLLVLPNALRAADLLPTNSSVLLMGDETRNQLTIMTNFIGFNGERRDPVTGLYHLGKGYRAYNPALMRFHAADSLSPFGDGGLNPYAYTLGNPINLLDPSGHMSVSARVGLGLGIFGLLISIFTLGAGIAAGAAMMTAGTALSITSSVLGIVSSATSIASALTEDSNPQASSILGWISLGTGIASAVTGIVGTSLGFSAAKMTNKVTPSLSSKNISSLLAVSPVDDVVNASVWRKGGLYMAKTTSRIAPNGNVPLQYLPYKPGSITTMNLNNSSKLFTTAELSGCGLLIEQGKKITSVAHIAGDVSNSSMAKIAQVTGSRLFNSANYANRATIFGTRSGSSWNFWAQQRGGLGGLIGSYYRI
ncbi:RHS repeat-associated core domain-containing protein [Aeromonas jandaei]|uniref:RHS repeat-associated core domain-containing protein n=1 Tax=Aeromonas jandaei TaxID=650 RepID=UPI003BA34FE5